jgi:hypothetical protein
VSPPRSNKTKKSEDSNGAIRSGDAASNGGLFHSQILVWVRGDLTGANTRRKADVEQRDGHWTERGLLALTDIERRTKHGVSAAGVSIGIHRDPTRPSIFSRGEFTRKVERGNLCCLCRLIDGFGEACIERQIGPF